MAYLTSHSMPGSETFKRNCGNKRRPPKREQAKTIYSELAISHHLHLAETLSPGEKWESFVV